MCPESATKPADENRALFPYQPKRPFCFYDANEEPKRRPVQPLPAGAPGENLAIGVVPLTVIGQIYPPTDVVKRAEAIIKLVDLLRARGKEPQIDSLSARRLVPNPVDPICDPCRAAIALYRRAMLDDGGRRLMAELVELDRFPEDWVGDYHIQLAKQYVREVYEWVREGLVKAVLADASPSDRPDGTMAPLGREGGDDSKALPDGAGQGVAWQFRPLEDHGEPRRRLVQLIPLEGSGETPETCIAALLAGRVRHSPTPGLIRPDVELTQRAGCLIDLVTEIQKVGREAQIDALQPHGDMAKGKAIEWYKLAMLDDGGERLRASMLTLGQCQDEDFVRQVHDWAREGLVREMLEPLVINVREQTEIAPSNGGSQLQEIAPGPRATSNELAEFYGLPPNALRRRLERYRSKNATGWSEDTEASRNSSRYIYETTAVMHIIESLKSSAERPSKE